MKISLRRGVFIFCLLVAWDLVISYAYYAWIQDQERFPQWSNAEVGMVLMGDFSGREDVLGPQTMERLDYALRLYNQQRVGTLFCVGGARPKKKIYGSDLMAEYLLGRGVPADKVIRERCSFSTETNGEFSRRMIQSHRWESLFIITSVLHQHRLKKIVARQPMGGVQVSYAPVPVPKTLSFVAFKKIWTEVHYEWLASILEFFPHEVRRNLVAYLRSQ